MNERPVARDSATRPVGELLRGPAPTCAPADTAADSARLMTGLRARCVVVPLPDGGFGIVTEGDLRRRIVAEAADPSTPLDRIMTAPALTVRDHVLGADALLRMLAHGVRRLPVVSATGALLGVIEDADLLADATRGGFLLRAEIARARDADALVAAAARLPSLAVTLTRSRIAALDTCAILSVVMEAAVTRAVDLTWSAGSEESPCGGAWLALGSIARREAVPSSDVDSATVHTHAPRIEGAERVLALLARGGLRCDDKGAVATVPRFARTLGDWHAAIDGWLADPWSDQALVMLGMLVDSRVVHGDRSLDLASHTANSLRARPEVLRLLLREAVDDKARIRRRIVSRRTDPVDVKAHGLAPIANIARWAGTAAGLAAETTPTRLRVAAERGLLSDDDGRVLSEAFDALTQIRLRHQCEQLEQGRTPTDVVDPETLSPLQRSLLSGAIREIAGVQRTLAYAGPPA